MASYTYMEILKQATICYNSTKKEQKNNISSKWSYYISKAILKPNHNINKIKIADAPNPYGEKINKEISKKDYLEIIERFIKYVEKNKKLPNYVTIKGMKVKPRLYTAFVSYILYKYHKNKKLPSKQKINSKIYKNPNKLHAYMTNQGCSGMGQCTGYYCACNSLQQSFYRLTGIHVDESTIAKWAGTTTSGTSHEGINTAVAMFNKTYNQNIKLTWYNFTELGKNDNSRWETLQNYIKKGAVFCHLLYRDQYGHYEVPLRVNSSNLDILNSLGSNCGGTSYCGYIETRSKTAQLRYMKGISQKSIAILTR